MPKQAADITDDESALLAVCGSESMVTQVKECWEAIMEKNKLDVSGQGLNDESVNRLLKGLHMCARGRPGAHLSAAHEKCRRLRAAAPLPRLPTFAQLLLSPACRPSRSCSRPRR